MEAIEVSGSTASKAVLFSGLTVVFALLGLFMIPTTIFRSLGLGAVLVVIVAVLAMLTLIPAMLSLLGDRIDWPFHRHYDDPEHIAAQQMRDQQTLHGGFWGTITRIVMARPVISLVLSAGLLIALAIPYFDLTLGFSGINTLPKSNIRDGYEILAKDFQAGRLSPVKVVIDGQQGQVDQGISNLQAAITNDPVLGSFEQPTWSADGSLAVININLEADPDSQVSRDAITKLRDTIVPQSFSGTSAKVYVSGDPAFNYDFRSLVSTWTPIVFAFVLLLSFILLTLAFRSIVVPIKAIIMNLLGVGAAYGILVLVFQKGYLHNVLGFQQVPAIEPWLPIFLFCVLFGLSMDYHVFLLSRIREHYDQSHRNRESVAVGLQSTARIITGAALIMVVGLLRLRGRAAGHVPADGLRPRHGGPDRCDHHPLGPRAVSHGAAGRPQLVHAEVAELAARPPRRRCASADNSTGADTEHSAGRRLNRPHLHIPDGRRAKAPRPSPFRA